MHPCVDSESPTVHLNLVMITSNIGTKKLSQCMGMEDLLGTLVRVFRGILWVMMAEDLHAWGTKQLS